MAEKSQWAMLGWKIVRDAEEVVLKVIHMTLRHAFDGAYVGYLGLCCSRQ